MTNQNSIQEEIKCRLKAGNSCYYSVQTLLSSRTSKNLKIKIHKTLVVLYGCETWSLTLMEKCWQRVFENRFLGKISGLKRAENGEWRRLHNEELHILYRSPNIVKLIKSRRLRWAGHLSRMLTVTFFELWSWKA